MGPDELLVDSLNSFAASCNENAGLMTMIKDWNRVLHVHATDLQRDLTLTTSNGSVISSSGAPASSDLALQATAEVLTAIFYGELSPNEPYNDGRLRIQGPESDIVKLDFLIAMLWD